MTPIQVTPRCHCDDFNGQAAQLEPGVLPMRVVTADLCRWPDAPRGVFDPLYFEESVKWWFPDESARRDTPIVWDIEIDEPKPPVKSYHALMIKAARLGFEQQHVYVWMNGWLQSMRRKGYWKKVLGFSREVGVYMGVHITDADSSPDVPTWCSYAAHFDRHWFGGSIPWTDHPWRDGLELPPELYTSANVRKYEHERTEQAMLNDLYTVRCFGGTPALFIPRNEVYKDIWGSFKSKWQSVLKEASGSVSSVSGVAA